MERRWEIALALLLLAAAAIIFHETRGTSFADDEWTWIVQRRGSGLGTLLRPHNDHLSLVPVAVYKLLFATAGLRTYTPYSLVALAAHLICGALVFVYARRRVGPYFALLAAALILLFGPGWQEFIWAFQMAWLFTIAAGLGALLLLERRDRAGDLGACVLLGVALASAGPGVAVAIGLVVEVALRRRRRDLWIVAIPIALYALWWVIDQQRVYSSPISAVPGFVARAAAGTMSAVTGLSQANAVTGGGHYLGPGIPLLVLALVLLAWRIRAMGRIPPRLLALLVMLAAFWITAGVGRAYVKAGPFVFKGSGYESRYLYVSAVLLVLIVVEVAPRARLRTVPLWGRALAGVLVGAILVSNLASLRHGAQAQRVEGELDRASLGALDMTRSIVSPDFTATGFAFGILKAGDYFQAERALGSPTATGAQIAGFPESVRELVDQELIQIHAIALRPASPASRHACATALPAATTTIAAGRLLVRAGQRDVTVGLRRFAENYTTIGTVSRGAQALLTISSDRSRVPWRVRAADAAGLLVCR